MPFINRKRTPKDVAERDANAHLNYMGGPSYFLNDPVASLQMAASSCFFGEPQYYQIDKADARPRRRLKSGRGRPLTDEEVAYLRETLNALDPQEWRSLSPAEVMEQAIDKALDHDIERTLQLAVSLRNNWHIRTTPQVILVRAAMHPSSVGTGLIRKYAKEIIRRADEPSVGLAYFIARFTPNGKVEGHIPTRLQKAWADALGRQDDYSLAKYRMEDRQVKTADVVSLVHAGSPSVDKLMKDQLRTTGETWEAIRSAGGSWEEALVKMGHMALLRNLRNLLNAEISPDLFVKKLIDGAAGGQQLPFRYYSAYQAVGEDAPSQVRDALEECLISSLGNVPTFRGRVASLCDNSGSAWGATTSSMGTMHVAQIANLSGWITGMNADEGYVGIFGDRLEMVPVLKQSGIFGNLTKLDKIGHGIGGSTENGIWLFWDQAIRQKEHWDHVFVYSDMQAGHGGLYGKDSGKYQDYVWRHGASQGRYIDVPKLVRTYREKVNPEVMVYLVQVGGYGDTIIPEFYERTAILGGWGEGLLHFAAAFSVLPPSKL